MRARLSDAEHYARTIGRAMVDGLIAGLTRDPYRHGREMRKKIRCLTQSSPTS